ncbi:MAG TPA: SMC-Scp complex subunit ScpB, partial [Candidatus Syntrophoarchaeum butanivorans]|nr:SMC-Scp complex subunit ScpB [Candidatus Syntrophoarchaeum butanivorans]
MKEGEVRARQIIEAALFISGSPLSSSRLARLAGLEEDEVEPILEELRSAYESRSSAIVIERSDDGWVMEVRKELGRELSEIVPRELDTPTLRTLAVIAYRQPITQSDLVKV